MKRIKSDIQVLSEKEMVLLFDNSLKVLDTMGIKVPNDEVLDMCADLNCIIDKEKQVVKFPVAVMEQFVEKMRAENLNQHDEFAAKLSGKISTQVSIVDYKTNTRRYGLHDDNLKAIALVQKLDNIGSCHAAVVPSDVPPDIADLISTVAIKKYSKKPGHTYIVTPIAAKYISQVNKVIGERTEYLLETISPLSFKQDTVDMALDIAKKGGRIAIAPMAMSSATAPTTISGTIVIQMSEILGSAFLVYMMTKEYPNFEASCHSVDLSTTLCSFGSPNQALFAATANQMARYCGMYSGSNSGLTDSLRPDFQGGFEKGITAVFNGLSGSMNIGCQGIVGADQGFSMEQLTIDNEWLGYYNYITEGFEVTQENIGYETIFDVGIQGNFLSEEHTVEHMKDNYWIGNLSNRDDWGNWNLKGAHSILDKAYQFVQEATANYKEMPLVIGQSEADELDEIVKAAYEEVNFKN